MNKVRGKDEDRVYEMSIGMRAKHVVAEIINLKLVAYLLSTNIEFP